VVSPREFSSVGSKAADEVDMLGFFTAARAEIGLPLEVRTERFLATPLELDDDAGCAGLEM
jgi:hypothetical protein